MWCWHSLSPTWPLSLHCDSQADCLPGLSFICKVEYSVAIMSELAEAQLSWAKLSCLYSWAAEQCSAVAANCDDLFSIYCRILHFQWRHPSQECPGVPSSLSPVFSPGTDVLGCVEARAPSHGIFTVDYTRLSSLLSLSSLTGWSPPTVSSCVGSNLVTDWPGRQVSSSCHRRGNWDLARHASQPGRLSSANMKSKFEPAGGAGGAGEDR